MSEFGTDARPRPLALAETSGLEFNAFGHSVHEAGRVEAVRHVLDMLPDLSQKAARVLVDDVARWVERDEPHTAMIEARAHLDLTGAYRLLAVLCTVGGAR